MNRAAAFGEFHVALQRPPFYPKLAILSRLLAQIGSIFVVVNRSQPWTFASALSSASLVSISSSTSTLTSSALVDVVEWLNLPSIALRGSFQQMIIVWVLMLAILVGGLAIGWGCFERMRRTLPFPPLAMNAVRALLGTIGKRGIAREQESEREKLNRCFPSADVIH